LRTSGVIQVALSFLNECIKLDTIQFHVLASSTFAFYIKDYVFPNNFHFYTIKSHPFLSRLEIAREMNISKLEKWINPDCVFTVFGPSWWTPRAPHLQGYALAHYLYKESPLYDIISFNKKVKIYNLSILHKFFFKRNGEFFVCETDDVSKRLSRFLNIPLDNIFTVTNTHNDFFNQPIDKNIKLLKTKGKDEFRFATLSSSVPHKNLQILNSIIPILRIKTNRDIKFVITISQEEKNRIFTREVRDSIYAIGRIAPASCPKVYDECDALFLPTLMECFSANYPEAMKMNKPILTSDISFAKVVCGNAALYFNPIEPNDIVDKLLLIINNQNLYSELVNRGRIQLMKFDTAQSRALKYIDICKLIANVK